MVWFPWLPSNHKTLNNCWFIILFYLYYSDIYIIYNVCTKIKYQSLEKIVCPAFIWLTSHFCLLSKDDARSVSNQHLINVLYLLGYLGNLDLSIYIKILVLNGHPGAAISLIRKTIWQLELFCKRGGCGAFVEHLTAIPAMHVSHVRTPLILCGSCQFSAYVLSMRIYFNRDLAYLGNYFTENIVLY